MASVFFSSAAEKDVRHLPAGVANLLRTEHIPKLETNPRAGKPLHGPLRGYFSYDFSAAGVSYRIAYELIKGNPILLVIDSRENFYKKFTRRIR